LLVKVGLIEIAIGPHRANTYRLSNGWRTVDVEERRRRQLALWSNATKFGRQLQDLVSQNQRWLAAAGFFNAGFAPEKVSTSTHIRFIGQGSR
jgi:hypothetical protein